MPAQCPHLTTAWRLPGTANCSSIHSLRVKPGILPQRYRAWHGAQVCGGEWKGPNDIFFSWKIMKGMKSACGLIVTLNVPHLDVMWMILPIFQMAI